eukprot:UN15425
MKEFLFALKINHIIESGFPCRKYFEYSQKELCFHFVYNLKFILTGLMNVFDLPYMCCRISHPVEKSEQKKDFSYSTHFRFCERTQTIFSNVL